MSDSQSNQLSLRLLGQAIREIREENSLSVKDLSTTTGVAESTIRTLEAGELDADLDLLLTLADALGLRPSAFVLRAEALANQTPRKENQHE